MSDKATIDKLADGIQERAIIAARSANSVELWYSDSSRRSDMNYAANAFSVAAALRAHAAMIGGE